MKLKRNWVDLGICGSFQVLKPSKTKKYLNKWLKLKENDIDEVEIYTSVIHYKPIVFIRWKHPFQDFTVFLFKDALDSIAKIENMRNADELCIWLDMRIEI